MRKSPTYEERVIESAMRVFGRGKTLLIGQKQRRRDKCVRKNLTIRFRLICASLPECFPRVHVCM